MARDMANNGIHDVFTGGDGDGYADTLFGKFVPAMRVATRRRMDLYDSGSACSAISEYVGNLAS